jgi:hypothetical protein
MKRFIYFTNSGGRITADELQMIVQAYNQEMPAFCEAHSIEVPVLTAAPDATTVPNASEVIDFKDQPPTGEDGVLGDHFEVLGKARGEVFAGYELDNGGAVLNNPPGQGGTTVAAIGYHELTEQLRNPDVNVWVDGPITTGGATYSSVVQEVGDPAEGDEGAVKQIVNGVEVWLCNTVTPAWFDPEATSGPYDRAGLLTAPFTVRATGYVAVRNAPGSETQVFGENMPSHRKKLKTLQWKRRLRRRPTMTQPPPPPPEQPSEPPKE